ncbi:hypothetical protein CKO25_15825 [Thiocapsa imhoffii]|uniref:Uncharacterized protein n=1 Tax=Thiocapsa imhoffii TaxID=382777 RepID=A0A9X0WKK2_9GAMM|nr:hypothetical protein [Thiocapsa imhoffii]
MTEREQTTDQPAIVRAFMQAKPAEQHLLLEWSRGFTAIRLSERGGGEKLTAFLALTRERRAAWPLVKLLGRALRILLWDARSWTFRLGVGSLLVVFVGFGPSAAALIPLVEGIRLPLWILVGGVAVLLGVLIDLIRKQWR